MVNRTQNSCCFDFYFCHVQFFFFLGFGCIDLSDVCRRSRDERWCFVTVQETAKLGFISVFFLVFLFFVF